MSMKINSMSYEQRDAGRCDFSTSIKGRKNYAYVFSKVNNAYFSTRLLVLLSACLLNRVSNKQNQNNDK
jgi:hypothetical protein